MSRLLFGALKLLSIIASRIPRRALLFLGKLLGLILFYIIRIRRGVALSNLRAVYGDEMGEKEIKRVARASYINLAKNYIDFLIIPRIFGRMDRFVEIEGRERLDSALAKGKGVLILTAHLGNWEILTVYGNYLGYQVNALSRVQATEFVNLFWNYMREKVGVKVISAAKGDSALRIVSSLRRGELVGFVLDQNSTTGEGVFVKFFGREACTFFGLAKLAVRFLVPVVPIFCIRERGETYRVIVGEEVGIEREGEEAELVVRNTQKFTDILETFIRGYPEQWIWVHRRWKTRRVREGGARE